MGDVMNKGILQDMGKRSMADIMHQNGCFDGFCFGVEDEISLLLERPDSLGHQVKSTDGMLKSCVTGTWIDHRCQSQLINTIETLEQGMLHDAVEQSAWYLDKPEYRVVDDLCAVHLLNNTSFLQFLRHLLLQFAGLVTGNLSIVVVAAGVDDAT